MVVCPESVPGSTVAYSVLQVGCPSEIGDRLLCLKWLVRH